LADELLQGDAGRLCNVPIERAGLEPQMRKERVGSLRFHHCRNLWRPRFAKKFLDNASAANQRERFPVFLMEDKKTATKDDATGRCQGRQPFQFHGGEMNDRNFEATLFRPDRNFTINESSEKLNPVDCKNAYRYMSSAVADVADRMLPSLSLIETDTRKVKADKPEPAEKTRQQLQDELETKYGVKFSKDGEKLWCGESIKKVECRAPKLRELEVLASVLRKSEPSQRTRDGGVKFNFLTENANKIHQSHSAFYEKDQVFIEPIAENQGLWQDAAYTHRSTKGHSLEALLTHELAHNSQENMGWDLSDRFSQKMIEVGKLYGFKLQQGLWLYEANTKTDGQNDLFHFDPDLFDSSKPDCKPWMRCDRKGIPLNAQGEPVHKSKAEFLGVEEMRDRAKVKPATWYAKNPTEADAEARTCLRLNRESRARMLTESPEVYAIAKDEDQQEIDKAFGLVEAGRDKGSPKYLRGLDGALNDNTPEIRRSIAKWEEEEREKSEKKKR